MIPACDRCRSFKKKCSRTFPVCALCANAGQKCSYSSPIASVEAQAHQLRERIKWLSQYINENVLPPGGDESVEAVETGTDLVPILGGREGLPGGAAAAVRTGDASKQTSRLPGLATPATPPSEIHVSRDQPSIGQPSIDIHSNLASPLDPGSVGATSSHLSYQGSTSTDGSNKRRKISSQNVPSGPTAIRFVDAYFRNVNRAYPFVNQAKVRRDLESLGTEGISRRHPDPGMTLLYLAMAIGCTTLERAGQIPCGTRRQFDISYSDIIQECLNGDTIESIQILVLLALYSLFDPAGTSAYSIVGIAARQAMLFGLTRRAPDEQTQDPVETELRHRLYWSIYVLDRMMAASQGLSVALIDENADVPLPSLTVEEFASPERSTYAKNLQTSRHVIQLRQLEDNILSLVHLRRQADAAALAPADRRAILYNIRAEIEDWYSNGCLMSPMEADNVPIHSSITWLSARYYHLLLLLYFPNYFNSSASAITRPEVLQFARKQIQSNSALFIQRQLPLNRVTLCRLFPVCLVVMHDFAATYGAEDWATLSTTQPYEAREEISLLISIFEAFPDGWVIAHQFGRIIQQFAGIIAGAVTPYYGTQASDSVQTLMKPCIAALKALMQQYLGKASCFQCIEFPPEKSEVKPLSVPQQQGTSTATDPMFYDEGSGEQAGVGDENLLNYGWGSWDLDFL